MRMFLLIILVMSFLGMQAADDDRGRTRTLSVESDDAGAEVVDEETVLKDLPGGASVCCKKRSDGSLEREKEITAFLEERITDPDLPLECKLVPIVKLWKGRLYGRKNIESHGKIVFEGVAPSIGFLERNLENLREDRERAKVRGVLLGDIAPKVDIELLQMRIRYTKEILQVAQAVQEKSLLIGSPERQAAMQAELQAGVAAFCNPYERS